eukprot:gnl/TRDRNA2_/TRDRNA2_185373_c0_seq1.p1 gnl/TRDRNA2_/TRDRNA2_185373_c0~~gnl/TRDRNA2_/TRDRNA2_185373_c0_seq1.p1  ORF type:complete len:177 (+),score=34.22 gnl/TRDRNA2_/TRDRNA2_185373_c0_seq1:86-616(+)
MQSPYLAVGEPLVHEAVGRTGRCNDKLLVIKSLLVGFCLAVLLSTTLSSKPAIQTWEPAITLSGQEVFDKEVKPKTDSIETIINVGKRIHGIQFKKRAPRAIREIRKVAGRLTGTQDVRIDEKLNKFIWSQGIRNVPKRVRVRLMRGTHDDDSGGKNKRFTVVQHVQVVKGLPKIK